MIIPKRGEEMMYTSVLPAQYGTIISAIACNEIFMEPQHSKTFYEN